ncbi:flavodoxin domain-containing protein [Aeromicrobium sp. Root472D3]|uniref:flavodoxin domain-containing protein n=1 Tax=Aeromicrobium sp. Root472D3 TaxID=1736540 RepID=UPI0006F7B114|nr:flavodoxin domain-containing protein [Aeromicrobium sp. Root472D3]KQX75867.1 hypothetical protein ASD10_12190 [Aeromicrobium sp. Root472D3]
MRSLVVAAASRHGSTAEIADRLAADLAGTLGDPWTVTRVGLTDPRRLIEADAVVLGSAVYYGRWMRSATHALDHLREEPPDHLWIFSTGPVSDSEDENARTISADAMADLGEEDEVDEHRVFGGRLDDAQLSFVERVVVRAVGATPGDHRRWDDVDAWARQIADELQRA